MDEGLIQQNFVYWGSTVEDLLLKVASFQKVWCVFQISKINITNHYPELEIWISRP